MPYYHHTSRLAAQNIVCTGIILPGTSGFVFLSTELYATGAAAADALGITAKALEIAFEISSNPPPPGLLAPAQVVPIVSPSGAVLRRGGGPEVRTPNPISAPPNAAKWITLREP